MEDQFKNPNHQQESNQAHWLDSTYSVRTSPHQAAVKRIVDAALAAVNPYQAIIRSVSRTENLLQVGNQRYDLDVYQQIALIGLGKAAFPMVSALKELLGDRQCGGMLVTKDGYANPVGGKRLEGIQICETGHPIPDARGIAAGQEIQRLLAGLDAQDLVIFLISGGGSALLTLPAPGVSLADMQSLTRLLLRCGAAINQINTLRKHLDQVKGGGLARLAAPAMMLTLALSDVIGDPPDIIASGPTTPDISTFQDAWAILDQYHLIDEIPDTIRIHLEKGCRGEVPETLKPADPIFSQTQYIVVGSNYQAACAAIKQAQTSGMNALLLTSFLQGEAREAGRMMAALARQIQMTGEPLRRPACIIAGGETTVTVRGNGKGGRNQELALGSLVDFSGLEQMMLVALATDGGDGPTDAAGAVVTGESLRRALTKDLDVLKFQEQNDAYGFFENLGDLLKPGPTQTNVNDLAFLFAF